MTVTSSPLLADMSRLYGAGPRPFRINRRTAFAIGVAAAFHAVVGFYVVKSHFETALTAFDEPPVISVQNWRPPPPPPPPPAAPAPRDPIVKAPPRLVPREVAAVAPTADVHPFETSVNPDAAPSDAPAESTAAPEPEPAPMPTPPPAVIRNPSWLKKPTASQVSALYPRRAAERNVEGGATLMCEVLADGVVNNCTVVDETPKGFRFGEAAVAISRYFRVNPRTVDGQVQAGSRVRIPIAFSLG